MGFVFKALGSLLIMGSVLGLSMVGSQFADKLNVTDRLLQAEKEKQQLREENKELTVQKEKLAMANKLLKVDYQLARLRLRSQEQDPQTKKIVSVVEFWEVDDQGNPLTRPQEYRIRGDNVYVEGLVAKFEDRFVEEGDPRRGTAMLAFKAIYGNDDTPNSGYPLTSKRTQPNAYERGGLPSPFEEALWRNFWDYAHDPAKMQELGLSAMCGKSVSTQLREGHEYSVKLRSTGDVTIQSLTRDVRESSRRPSSSGTD
jgi:hypothetical protein